MLTFRSAIARRPLLVESLLMGLWRDEAGTWRELGVGYLSPRTVNMGLGLWTSTWMHYAVQG